MCNKTGGHRQPVLGRRQLLLAAVSLLVLTPQAKADAPLMPGRQPVVPAQPAPASEPEAQPEPEADGSGPGPASDPAWWISPQGTARGPFSEQQLIAMAEAGEIGLRTHVWQEGMAAWARLGEVAALAPVAQAVRLAEEARQIRAFTALLLGSWAVEGRTQDDGEYRTVTIRLSFRPDGSFAWSFVRKDSKGEVDSRFDKGPFSVKPKDVNRFDLFLECADITIQWEIVVIGPDRLDIVPLKLTAERQS